ncbi:MAG: polyprenyl synthetase family protein [Chlamydiota bacterium]
MPLPLFATPILSLIERQLQTAIPEPVGPHGSLFEAARYTLLAPSKRLRPLFLLTLLQDFEIPFELGLDPAVALECVHSYSLIHDDLPCMDNDDFRRGKPALHKVYDPAQALLVGDYLLTRAFEILSQTASLDPFLRLALTEVLAKKAGSEGMIGGQVIDLIAETTPLSPKDLEQMHRWKTGSLFAAACTMAAIIAKLEKTERETINQCGELFGIAFQIADDLDDRADDAKIMKKNGQTHQKSTFTSYYGLKQTIELKNRFFARTFEMLDSLACPTPRFHQLIVSLQSSAKFSHLLPEA